MMDEKVSVCLMWGILFIHQVVFTLALPVTDVTDREGWKKITLWPGGVIPYLIPDGTYDDTQRGLILAAMRRWERKTCIQFMPWTSEMDRQTGTTRYIKFAGSGSCFSDTGVSDKKQPQLIGIGTSGCMNMGTIVHELGHAIGMEHEMSRVDRDLYLQLRLENMNPDSRINYWTTDELKLVYPLYDTPYDYKSIMHYTPKAWSSNGEVVIVTKDPAYQDVIGRVSDVSFFDALYVSRAYNCAAKCSGKLKTCMNGGFLGGAKCTCICQEGYTGEGCNQTLPGYENTVRWSCPAGWEFQGNTCFFYDVGADRDFSRTYSFCRSKNSNMVSFKTSSELDWLREVTAEKMLSTDKRSFWVGITRLANSKEYLWTDRSLVDQQLVQDLVKDDTALENTACSKFDGDQIIMDDCSAENAIICMTHIDPGCGGRYTVTGSNTTIHSPGYPNSYSNDLDCTYILQTNPSSRIRITFETFYLAGDCRKDYLEVQLTDDATKPGIRYCKDNLRNQTLYSEGHLAILTMRTDSSVTSTGFTATVDEVRGYTVTTPPAFSFFSALKKAFSPGSTADATVWNMSAFFNLFKSMSFSRVL